MQLSAILGAVPLGELVVFGSGELVPAQGWYLSLQHGVPMLVMRSGVDHVESTTPSLAHTCSDGNTTTLVGKRLVEDTAVSIELVFSTIDGQRRKVELKQAGHEGTTMTLSFDWETVLDGFVRFGRYPIATQLPSSDVVQAEPSRGPLDSAAASHHVARLQGRTSGSTISVPDQPIRTNSAASGCLCTARGGLQLHRSQRAAIGHSRCQ